MRRIKRGIDMEKERHKRRRNEELDQVKYEKPIPVTARSKVWVCSRLISGTVGSISR